MRRPTASPAARLETALKYANDVVDSCLVYARSPTEGLGRLPRALAGKLAELGDIIDRLMGMDVMTSCGRELWAKVLQLHAFALRELQSLYVLESARVERVEDIVSKVLFMVVNFKSFKSSSDLRRFITLALIRSDTFECYAQLINTWKDVPPRYIESKLRLMAQFSLVFSNCAQVAVAERPSATHGAEPGGSLSLYTEYIRSLASSQLLEHISRALLSVQEATHWALARGEIDPQLAQSLRTGAVETCGCIVSALYAVAGKQAIMDCCWARVDSTGPSAPLNPRALAVLPEAAEVLSGPCLQFLLGRELVACRLRLSRGQGPRHGLPEPYLPEATSPTGVAGASSHSTSALYDRLLSRIGAATLVWQLVYIGPRGGAAAAALAPAAAAGEPSVSEVPFPAAPGPSSSREVQQPAEQTQQQRQAEDQANGSQREGQSTAAGPSGVGLGSGAAVGDSGAVGVGGPTRAEGLGGGARGCPSYRPVNIFDLLLETLGCVVIETPVEHLPGGSQLTLTEPVLLMLGLLVLGDVRPRHVASRLAPTWALVVDLLRRRPAVKLRYAGSRPAKLIAKLLTMDPERAAGRQGAGQQGPGQDVGQGTRQQQQRQQQQQEHDAGEGPAGPGGAASEAAGRSEAAGSGGAVEGLAGAGAAEVIDLSDVPGSGAAPAPAMTTDAGASAISAADPALTVRTALAAGLVPALDDMLRHLTDQRHMEGLTIIDHILRSTGVWPALVAHSPLRDVASLAQAVRSLEEGIKFEVELTIRLNVARNKDVTESYKEAAVAIACCQATLLEQLAAVLLLPPRAPPAVACAGTEGALARTAAVGGAFGSTAVQLCDVPPPPPPAPFDPLELNRMIAENRGRQRPLDHNASAQQKPQQQESSQPHQPDQTGGEAAQEQQLQQPQQRDEVQFPQLQQQEVQQQHRDEGQRSYGGRHHRHHHHHHSADLCWIEAAGGRPAPGSEADRQLRLLTVYQLMLWLPGTLWTGSILRNWFSRPLCKVVSRWLLQCTLQCLAAKLRGSAGSAASAASAGPSSCSSSPASRPSAAGTACCGAAPAAGAAASAGEVPRSAAATAAVGGPGALHVGPMWSVGAAAAASGLSTDYVSWVFFLVSHVQLRTWMLALLQEKLLLGSVRGGQPEASNSAMDGSGASGSGSGSGTSASGGSGSGTSGPGEGASVVLSVDPRLCYPHYDVLLPATLDALEVMACAAPEVVRTWVEGAPVEGQAGVPEGRAAPFLLEIGQGKAGAAAAAAAAAPDGTRQGGNAGGASAATEAPQQRKQQGEKREQRQEKERQPEGATLAPEVLQLLEEQLKEALVNHKFPTHIALTDRVREALHRHGRGALLAVLELWVAQNRAAAAAATVGGASSAAASDVGGRASTVGKERLDAALSALMAKVSADHDLAALPELPSPWTARQAISAAGLPWCDHPACTGGERAPAAEPAAAAAGRKVCRRCGAAQYCSGGCQLAHWMDGHQEECARHVAMKGAAAQPAAAGAAPAAATVPAAVAEAASAEASVVAPAVAAGAAPAAMAAGAAPAVAAGAPVASPAVPAAVAAARTAAVAGPARRARARACGEKGG